MRAKGEEVADGVQARKRNRDHGTKISSASARNMNPALGREP